MDQDRDAAPDPQLRRPTVDDGLALWRLADEAGGLDVNSAYAYVLWTRDFAETTVVAPRAEGNDLVGFITGYRRPSEPGTLFVWQVAVHPDARGRRLGVAMLHHLADTVPGVDTLEATVAPDNVASQRTFERFADERGARLEVSPLFGPDHLPAGHEAEDLWRIAPLR